MINDINDTKDKCLRVFRLLNTYKENSLKVHMKFDKGSESGAFKNGKVISVSKENETVFFNERVDGKKIYELKNIDPDSICEFIPKEGEK